MLRSLFIILIFLFVGDQCFAQQTYLKKGDFLLSLGSGYPSDLFKMETGRPKAPNFKPIKIPPIYLKSCILFSNSFSVSATAQWRLYQSSGSLYINNSYTDNYDYHTFHQLNLQVFVDYYWLKREKIMMYTSIGAGYVDIIRNVRLSDGYPLSRDPVNNQIGSNGSDGNEALLTWGGTLFGMKLKLSNQWGLEIEGPQTGISYARIGVLLKLNNDKEYKGYMRPR